MLLVLLAQPFQNLDSLVDRRWLDDDGLEATLEGTVLLDVLAILVQSRRTDALQLSTRKRWLEHVAGIDCAFGCARTHERVQLVDEQDDVLVLGDLVHHRLEALLELTAILGAGDHGRHVERKHAIVPERIGALSIRNQLRESFDDSSLANPRLSDENRIVLLAARQ